MKMFKAALAALALAGCGSQSHTLAVEGEPDAVARFVAAEEARAGEVDVRYGSGGRRAEFSVPDEDAQTAMRLRAAAARLAATESSVVWSFSTDS
jgi:hypothetical protein